MKTKFYIVTYRCDDSGDGYARAVHTTRPEAQKEAAALMLDSENRPVMLCKWTIEGPARACILKAVTLLGDMNGPTAGSKARQIANLATLSYEELSLTEPSDQPAEDDGE